MVTIDKSGIYTLGDRSVKRLGYGAMQLAWRGEFFGPPNDRDAALAVLREAVAPLTVLAELQQRGLIRHIGLSNVTAAQIAEGQRITRIACVQNLYNVALREDDALIDSLARDGIAYCDPSARLVATSCNCIRRPCRMLLRAWGLRRGRSPLPGYCAVRPTFC